MIAINYFSLRHNLLYHYCVSDLFICVYEREDEKQEEEEGVDVQKCVESYFHNPEEVKKGTRQERDKELYIP